MAKAPPKAGRAEKPLPKVEIEPGAWERFKSAVHMMARPKAAQPFKAAKASKAKKRPAKK
jgi:hypothetical protein